MNNPLLSVIIPVKNNTNTLEYTLKTVLAQDYSNLQIIVSNASNEDSVKDLINNLNDKRIKCVTPNESISFSADWEFALNGADGEYVTFLGDDDAALPNSYSLGMSYILDNDVDAFVWKKINYNWPDHLLPQSRNILNGSSSPEIQKINAKKALKQLSKFRVGYNFLPCIYNSIISVRDIKSVVKNSKKGTFFSGSVPDVYSGIALSSFINKYYYASFPLTINGASVKSTGVIQSESNLTKDQTKQISFLIKTVDSYHKDIGEYSTSISSLIMGEYILARENIAKFAGPKPSWFLYVRHLLHEVKTSNQSEKIIAAARFTIKKRGLFMPLFFIKTNSKMKKKYPASFFNGYFNLPVQKIKNVEDASILLGGLVPSKNSITIVNSKSILTRWTSNSIKTMIDLYRSIKL